MKTTLPDLNMPIEDIVAEGNKVAVRVTQQATNTGPLVGLPVFGRLETPVPPTGKSIIVDSMMIFKIADDRITSYATVLDQIGLLRQLGWTFTPPAQD